MKKIFQTAACLSVLFLIGCRGTDFKNIYIQEIDIALSESVPNDVGINLKDQQISAEEFSDIAIAVNEKGFIVATPKNGAIGIYLRTLVQYGAEELQNSLEECLLRENELLPGSKPVTSEGDAFCWKTTNNIYLVVIKRFVLEENDIKITIQYISY